MAEHYDIAIIGSGPGGYVAAIRAAQLGFKTVCIDKYPALGGTCLNVGCIPSKTLLQATERLYHLQHQGKEEGIECTGLNLNFSILMERKKQVIKGLNEGISTLFRQREITSLQGVAEFIDSHCLRVTSNKETVQEVEASYILIATGSEPISLPSIPFDERQIVSSTGALSLTKVPDRLVVIGAGVIGVELASVYSRLGSQVTILEMMDRICPMLDGALSKQLMKTLQKQGIEFSLSSKLLTAIVQPNEVALTADLNGKMENISADVLLVAVGRRAFTAGLQLERAGIQTDKKGFIVVDAHFRTTLPHVYAIGDVIEGVMLAHRASAEGVAVVESLKGESSTVDYLAIPNVIYTYPEVATVGLTEEEGRKAGLDLLVGTSFFRGNARARCSGETEGFVKIVGDKRTGRLVGMHLLGPHASELISEGVLAMQTKAKVEDLANATQAHPTLSEAIKEAALDALGRAIHH